MKRFFFHISDIEWYRDEAGENFETLEEALVEARKIASELYQDGDIDLNTAQMRITDEGGAVVALLGFKALLQEPGS